MKFNLLIALMLFCGLSLVARSLPNVNNEYDVEDVLRTYPAYLNFVTEVGQSVSPREAKLLVQLYTKLRRANPKGAALFLKGLRFELVEKMELLGSSPSQFNSQNPVVRKWVAKYIKEWVREADEHLFRSYTLKPNSSLAKRE